jgi:hypothetical protein
MDKRVAPFKHIILIPSQPEATNINFIIWFDPIWARTHNLLRSSTLTITAPMQDIEVRPIGYQLWGIRLLKGTFACLE